LSHRDRWWLVMVVLAMAASAEWLRAPSTGLAAAAAGLAVAAAVFSAMRKRPVDRVLAAALLLLAGTVAVTAYRLRLIALDWPAQREARITAYGTRVGGELRSALRAAVDLAERGAQTTRLPQERAFAALGKAVPRDGVELGVVVLDSTGAPWAWAGRQRLAPDVAGDSIGARTSGYYVTLETRRHSGGRVVVASALIWADSAVADRERSVAERFRRETEVGLRVYAPGAAPEHNPDIFDYAEPTTAGPRLLFSVQPEPPTQDEARLRVFTRGGRFILVLIGLAALLALAGEARPGGRYILLAGPLWTAVRAPLSSLVGLQALFSPATFSDPLLGPLTSSPAALLLTGALGMMLALQLWRWQARRRVVTRASGLVAIIGAALVLWHFGRRVSPPAGGADAGLWLVWQSAVMLAGASLASAGTALLDLHRSRWCVVVAMVGATILTGFAVWSWSPMEDWGLWLVAAYAGALILASLSGRRPGTLAGLAVIAGLLASLLIWRSGIRGRITEAGQDVARLGAPTESAVVPLLAQLAARVRDGPAPAGGAALYELWQNSALDLDGYPAQLALWDTAGQPIADLPLDSLAVTPELLGSLVRGLPDSVGAREVTSVPAVPATHEVLVLRLTDTTALTVSVGPRSALVGRDRLGRLLAPLSRRAASYRLVLGSPVAPSASSDVLAWRRTGSTLQASHPVPVPGGTREVQGTIELLGTVPLAVRAALIALLDVLLVLLLWGASRALTGEIAPAPAWRRMLRSFRLRVALALAFFFVLPTLAFSVWAFSHFADESERGRDLLIRQTLRDAAQGAGSILRTPGAPLTAALRGLSERVDADLALYRGGLLVATSAPVLRDLGVVSPLMDPAAFRALALRGEIEAAGAGVVPALAERVGYRIIEFGPPSGLGVLVTPQAGGDVDPGRPQRELAFILLLGAALGIAAAIAGAGVVARALTRPVADLRRSALALGQGKPTPLPESVPPVEFEPVFGAFQRMAADVHASQAALEAARRRTAAVLATVTTGVVAVDAAGGIMIANARARELASAPLLEGTPLAEALTGPWSDAREQIEHFVGAPDAAGESHEFTVGERRLVMEMAPLGSGLNGVVVALNDVTDLSRAERVLAWGEMARQVAHEIKNPLTPMRLGIQHLRRVHQDRREDFDRTLAETSDRILAEIDRLDTIARAFSRFAAPDAGVLPVERVDLAATAADVVQLYRLAGDTAVVTLDAVSPALGGARRDEVKEVLVNLIENAREAGARHVTVRVAPGRLEVEDDGAGMAPGVAARIFEPRFSTNTSGSGLGLAIVKRLVESWGGSVSVESDAGRGTVVRVVAGPLPG
jgi:signal transduction histidine kinase